jgi:hypothetical protein
MLVLTPLIHKHVLRAWVHRLGLSKLSRRKWAECKPELIPFLIMCWPWIAVSSMKAGMPVLTTSIRKDLALYLLQLRGRSG